MTITPLPVKPRPEQLRLSLRKRLLRGVLDRLPDERKFLSYLPDPETEDDLFDLIPVVWFGDDEKDYSNNIYLFNEQSRRVSGIVGVQRAISEGGRQVDCVCFNVRSRYMQDAMDDLWLDEEKALELLGFPTYKANDIDKEGPTQALLNGNTILVTEYEVPLRPGSLQETPITTDVLVIPLLPIKDCRDDFRMAQFSFITTQGKDLALPLDSGANSQP